MASFLRMPGVSADSDEALLAGWEVKEGAEIASGDVVASVETEKAIVDIEADQSAVVHTLLVEDGTTVAVGDPIAILLAPGEDDGGAKELLAQLGRSDAAAGEPAASNGRATTDLDVPQEAIAPETDAEGKEPGVLPAAATATAEAAPQGPGERVFASPIARRIARENGIDPATITGSGPGGRIVRKDVERAVAARSVEAVERAAAEPEAAPAPAAPGTPAPAAPAPTTPGAGFTDVPHSKLRRLVASRLAQSKQQAPHFYLRATVRVDDLLALRQQINDAGTTRVSVNDFFVRAVAKALVDVPEMNVVWTEDAVRRYEAADVAVAVASERGLVTPVVRGADTMSLTAIAATVKDYAARANEGRLQQHELEGGTFSVTNLGMFGVEEFAAIINPPHVGILAVGAARREPVVGEDGELTVGTVVRVTLSVDHRPVDGVVAARWLGRLTELLENPLQILV